MDEAKDDVTFTADHGSLRQGPRAPQWEIKRRTESSSGGEFHPSALTEPDVRLSPHPAPTLQPPAARRVATGQTGWGPAAQCTPASAWTRVPDA